MSLYRLTIFVIYCAFLVSCGKYNRQVREVKAQDKAVQDLTNDFFSRIQSGTYENKLGMQIILDKEARTFILNTPGSAMPTIERMLGEDDKGAKCDLTEEGQISKVVSRQKTMTQSEAYEVKYVFKKTSMVMVADLSEKENKDCLNIKKNIEGKVGKEQSVVIISLSKDGFEFEKSIFDRNGDNEANIFRFKN